MQKNRIILLTKTDGSLELVYGRLKAAHCSWGPGGPSRMGKMQRKEIHADLGVCVLCRHLKMHVCVVSALFVTIQENLIIIIIVILL